VISVVCVLCVQIGVLAGVMYVGGAFVFNVLPSKLYHAPIAAVAVINALIARFTDTTTIYVVPTPSKPKEKAAVHSGFGEKSDAAKSD